MGGSGFLSSGDDEEEKKEALGVKVFRPKVATTAPNNMAAQPEPEEEYRDDPIMKAL